METAEAVSAVAFGETTFVPPPTQIPLRWQFRNKPETEGWFHSQVDVALPSFNQLDGLTVEVKAKGIMRVEIKQMKDWGYLHSDPPLVNIPDGAYRTFGKRVGPIRVDIYSRRSDQPITVKTYPDDTFTPPAKK